MKIILENNRHDLAKLQNAIDTFTEEHNLNVDIGFGLNLALEELFINVILHAYDDRLLHAIEISLDYDANKITGQITDDGRCFDPTLHPEPDLSAKLEERKNGGLGIHLARRFFDNWKYHREKDKNILNFEKRLIRERSG